MNATYVVHPWQAAIVAYFTVQRANDPYLGFMLPLRKEDVFADPDIRILENHPGMPPSESSFNPLRGVLTAGALSLPIWAVVLVLCWRIWL